MKRSSAWAMLAVALWRTLPIERQLSCLLRVGVIGCYLGHGAYAVLTREAWLHYFGVVGIDRARAYQLMPWIGVMDVGLGLTMAVVPLPIVLLHLTVWGAWTAALRPLSGDSIWEFVERAGNYGVPLAFLVLASVPRHLRGARPRCTIPQSTAQYRYVEDGHRSAVHDLGRAAIRVDRVGRKLRGPVDIVRFDHHSRI
jgi:hypothetical protein